MNIRLIGAILIFVGCGGFGFSMAVHYRKQERYLQQLVQVLDYFSCELQYRLTPLPEICRSASTIVDGIIGRVFLDLAARLESQAAPDASGCMDLVLAENKELPRKVAEILSNLGKSLGHFDLNGQLTQIKGIRTDCQILLDAFRASSDIRIRNFQTLGLCAGAALAILLI